MKKLYYVISIMISLSVQAQTAAIFGGDAAASGYPHTGNTANKWTKFGEITLSGAYNPATLVVDLFPEEAPHGDSRQLAVICLRNGLTDFNAGQSDISLITLYGKEKTVQDIKVIRTTGSGTSSSTYSIWFQFGTSWVGNIPIEVRTMGNVSYNSTNAIYKPDIDETGTVYDVTSRYGMYGDSFEVEGTIRATEVKVEAEWWDEVFEKDYELTDLFELEEFVKSNKHLPGIPTEDQIEKEGVELGNTVSLLLKKIEELTLYTIDQEHRIKELEKRLNAQ